MTRPPDTAAGIYSKTTKKGRYKNMTNIEKLAQRIIDLDFFGARDADATPETVADDIRNNPAAVIEYLLDMIDDLQA